jgi:hypothetical protein
MGFDPETIILADDLRVRACEVLECAELGAEEHHWAPRSLFADANRWPTSKLCKKHHELWHKTTGLAVSTRCSKDQEFQNAVETLAEHKRMAEPSNADLEYSEEYLKDLERKW